MLCILHSTRLPFDWDTPFGYLMAVGFEYILFFSFFSMLIPDLCLTFGTSWLFDAYIDEIIRKLNVLSNGSQADGEDPTVNHRDMRAIFCDVIQEISQVKEFSSVRRSNSFFETYSTEIECLSDLLAHTINATNSIQLLYSFGD